MCGTVVTSEVNITRLDCDEMQLQAFKVVSAPFPLGVLERTMKGGKAHAECLLCKYTLALLNISSLSFPCSCQESVISPQTDTRHTLYGTEPHVISIYMYFPSISSVNLIH